MTQFIDNIMRLIQTKLRTALCSVSATGVAEAQALPDLSKFVGVEEMLLLIEGSFDCAAAVVNEACVVVAAGARFHVLFGSTVGRHVVESFDDEIASSMLSAARNASSEQSEGVKAVVDGISALMSFARLKGNGIVVIVKTEDVKNEDICACNK